MTRSLAEIETQLTEALAAFEVHLEAIDARWGDFVEYLDSQGRVLRADEIERLERAYFVGELGEEPLFQAYLALRAALGALQDHNDATFWQAHGPEEEAPDRAMNADGAPVSMAEAKSGAGSTPAADPAAHPWHPGEDEATVLITHRDAAAAADAARSDDCSGRRSLKERLDQIERQEPMPVPADRCLPEPTSVTAGAPSSDEGSKGDDKRGGNGSGKPRRGVRAPRLLGEEAVVEIVHKRPAREAAARTADARPRDGSER